MSEISGKAVVEGVYLCCDFLLEDVDQILCSNHTDEKKRELTLY